VFTGYKVITEKDGSFVRGVKMKLAAAAPKKAAAPKVEN
jgi:hypothetical protein